MVIFSYNKIIMQTLTTLSSTTGRMLCILNKVTVILMSKILLTHIGIVFANSRNFYPHFVLELQCKYNNKDNQNYRPVSFLEVHLSSDVLFYILSL